MAIRFLSSVAMLVALSPLSSASPVCARNIDSCLPAGVQATDVVSSQAMKPGGKVVTVTVSQKLKALGARCRKGKLVDAKKRKFAFTNWSAAGVIHRMITRSSWSVRQRNWPNYASVIA